MGQAKKRGSREQRIADALGLNQRTLVDIKKEYGLPATAEFLGYGVHLPVPDEFLAMFEDTAVATKKAWCKNPQAALTMDSFADAYETSRKCRDSTVVGIFDLGDQIYVAQIGGEK
ncbi:hypothetical protein PQU95_05105 [Vogesella sp. DC21W]|uniref:Uncharacterized protein n=1 Tax=Vogesella aquatica TaxID=2984206 RepID=A0ABT5IVN7_9NEIS|nr:hypothetical protein [Vogesella aquatica]MDC7716589.1 hypothetical protein [Vogesella aquatica]